MGKQTLNGRLSQVKRQLISQLITAYCTWDQGIQVSYSTLCIFNLLPSPVFLSFLLIAHCDYLTTGYIFTQKNRKTDDCEDRLYFYRNRCCLLLKKFCQYFIIKKCLLKKKKKCLLAYKVCHTPCDSLPCRVLCTFKGLLCFGDLLYCMFDTIKKNVTRKQTHTGTSYICDLHLEEVLMPLIAFQPTAWEQALPSAESASELPQGCRLPALPRTVLDCTCCLSHSHS